MDTHGDQDRCKFHGLRPGCRYDGYSNSSNQAFVNIARSFNLNHSVYFIALTTSVLFIYVIKPVQDCNSNNTNENCCFNIVYLYYT